jgi:hypothetical protein
MVSERKLLANRRNAQRSTGPRTDDGKAASSQNALTHGLTAASDSCAVLPSEDEVAYEELLLQLEREQRPQGVLQREIVGHIAQVLWKLRRVPSVERSLVFNRFYWAKRHHTLEQRRYKDHIERDLEPAPLPDLPMLLAREFDGGDNGFARLELYRQRLQRELRAAMRELRKLKEESHEHEDDPPPPRLRGGGEGQTDIDNQSVLARDGSQDQATSESTRVEDPEHFAPPPSPLPASASGEGEQEAARSRGAGLPASGEGEREAARPRRGGENVRGKNEPTAERNCTPPLDFQRAATPRIEPAPSASTIAAGMPGLRFTSTRMDH